MLVLENEIKKTLYFYAKNAYPEECCGILLGKREDGKRYAYKVIATENMSDEKRKGTHFRISPLEVARIEMSAEREGLEMIGFYHSHPNYDASVSREDARYMLSGYSYPIISINDAACQMACFEKSSQAGAEVKEEKIMIQGET